MVIDIRDDNQNIVKRLEHGKKINYNKLKHKPKSLKKFLKSQIVAKAKKVEEPIALTQEVVHVSSKKVKDLKKLKGLVPNLKDAKYANIERIIIPDVVIHEKRPKPGHPLRSILIQKLVVLNTEDDDPSDHSIFVEKAVIDPSLYRTKTMDTLKVKLFRNQGKVFNSQLDELTQEINHLKLNGMKHRKTKKSKNFLNKKIQHIQSLLNQIKVPVVPSEFKTSSIKKDMTGFEEHLEAEIKKIEGLAHPHSVKELIRKQKKVNKLGKYFTKYFSKHKAPAAQRKFKLMLKIIQSMGKELHEAKSHNKQLVKKMKAHQVSLNAMLKIHKAIVISASEAHGKVIRKLTKELKSEGKALK